MLGTCFARALGDMKGITRYGSILLPMDETLVAAAVDISGRGQLHYKVDVPAGILGTCDTSLSEEFWIAFASNMGVTLHLRSIEGRNAHHIIEALFKAAAKALMQAVAPTPRIAGQVPSTKGVL